MRATSCSMIAAAARDQLQAGEFLGERRSGPVTFAMRSNSARAASRRATRDARRPCPTRRSRRPAAPASLSAPHPLIRAASCSRSRSWVCDRLLHHEDSWRFPAGRRESSPRRASGRRVAPEVLPRIGRGVHFAGEKPSGKPKLRAASAEAGGAASAAWWGPSIPAAAACRWPQARRRGSGGWEGTAHSRFLRLGVKRVRPFLLETPGTGRHARERARSGDRAYAMPRRVAVRLLLSRRPSSGCSAGVVVEIRVGR